MNEFINHFWPVLALFASLGISCLFGLVAETMRRNGKYGNSPRERLAKSHHDHTGVT